MSKVNLGRVKQLGKNHRFSGGMHWIEKNLKRKKKNPSNRRGEQGLSLGGESSVREIIQPLKGGGHREKTRKKKKKGLKVLGKATTELPTLKKRKNVIRSVEHEQKPDIGGWTIF